MLQQLILAVSCISAVLAAPTAQTIAGPFDCIPAGTFTLCQNLWGRGESLRAIQSHAGLNRG